MTQHTRRDVLKGLALGAARVAVAGNLKYAAPPLPADAAKLEALRAAIGARPVWIAASIHPGEEAAVADAQARLRRASGALGIVELGLATLGAVGALDGRVDDRGPGRHRTRQIGHLSLGPTRSLATVTGA